MGDGISRELVIFLQGRTGEVKETARSGFRSLLLMYFPHACRQGANLPMTQGPRLRNENNDQLSHCTNIYWELAPYEDLC